MSPLSRLNQKLSVARGLNSSNSVSIESPGMRSQLFEIDLRPVAPDNAHMALRLAIYELGKMVAKGLTEDEFKRARDSLIREIDLASADPSRLLDDTLDAKWLGIPDFWSQERRKLSELTLDEVNRVIRKYLQNQHMYVMITAPDARKLRADLLKKPLPIKYNGERPKALVAEDELVANLNLEIESEDIRMYLISDAFGD